MTEAKPHHKVAFDEITAFLTRHAEESSAMDLLAIASNMVGKLVAMQDQRSTTPEQVMLVVSRNIEIGNQEAVARLMDSKGSG